MRATVSSHSEGPVLVPREDPPALIAPVVDVAVKVLADIVGILGDRAHGEIVHDLGQVQVVDDVTAARSAGSPIETGYQVLHGRQIALVTGLLLDPGDGIEEYRVQVAPLDELVEIAGWIIPVAVEKIFIHLFDENADTIEDSVQPHVPKSRIATRVPGRLVGLEGQSLPHVGAVGSPRVHVDLAHRGHIAVDVEAVPLVEVELLGTPIGCATTFPDKDIIIESLAEVDRGPRPAARVGGRLALREPLEDG